MTLMRTLNNLYTKFNFLLDCATVNTEALILIVCLLILYAYTGLTSRRLSKLPSPKSEFDVCLS
jgi:hypothetical protein